MNFTGVVLCYFVLNYVYINKQRNTASCTEQFFSLSLFISFHYDCFYYDEFTTSVLIVVKLFPLIIIWCENILNGVYAKNYSNLMFES